MKIKNLFLAVGAIFCFAYSLNTKVNVVKPIETATTVLKMDTEETSDITINKNIILKSNDAEFDDTAKYVPKVLDSTRDLFFDKEFKIGSTPNLNKLEIGLFLLDDVTAGNVDDSDAIVILSPKDSYGSYNTLWTTNPNTEDTITGTSLANDGIEISILNFPNPILISGEKSLISTNIVLATNDITPNYEDYLNNVVIGSIAEADTTVGDTITGIINNQAVIAIIYTGVLTFFSKIIIKVFTIGVNYNTKLVTKEELLLSNKSVQSEMTRTMNVYTKSMYSEFNNKIDLKLEPLEKISDVAEDMKLSAVSIDSDMKHMKEQYNRLVSLQQTTTSLSARVSRIENGGAIVDARRKNI